MQGMLKGNLSLCVGHERAWNHIQTVCDCSPSGMKCLCSEKSSTITAHQTAGASALGEAALRGCWSTSCLSEFWINVLSCSWCPGRKLLTSSLLRACYKCCPLPCSPWWALYVFFFVALGMHRAVDDILLAHQHHGTATSDASELQLGHLTDASTGVE